MDPFLFGPALAGWTYISDWRREATCLQGAQTRQAIKGPANLITGRGATNGGGRGGGQSSSTLTTSGVGWRERFKGGRGHITSFSHTEGLEGVPKSFQLLGPLSQGDFSYFQT